MSIVIGIDLGTVNSCVSYLDEHGVPRVIPDAEGNTTQPSVFAVNSSQESLVGRKARAQVETNRTNTIFAIKRLIGRKFDTGEVREATEKLPYKIIPAANGDAWVEVNGEPMSPAQISAEILTHMRRIAEQHLKQDVTMAVITVPAHFNDAQRQATRDAGEIAGLKVLNIINEPTAAALAYGIDAEVESRRIAVFDLGGGTFDVSVLSLDNGRFEVLSTNGDTYLGGEDFDLAIVSHFLTKFQGQYGIDLTQDKAAMQRVKAAATDAKHALSDIPRVQVNLPYVSSKAGAPIDLNMVVDRRTLERSVAHLLNALDKPCNEALEDAGLKPEDIDDVILVGGMTRMPIIKKQCMRIFGCQPIDEINPDTAVAAGAAIQAGIMQGLLKNLSFSDVTSLAFGIEVQGGLVATMLEKNSTIPCEHTEIMTTTSPMQTEIMVHIVQGDSPYVRENKSLGLFTLKDIPPAPRGQPEIEIRLQVDENGLIHVSATDLETKSKKEIDILPTSGLDQSELDKLVQQQKTERLENTRRAKRKQERASEYREKLRSDISAVHESAELVEEQGRLKSLLFATQFKLDTDGMGYRGTQRDFLEKALKKARVALEEALEPEPLRDAYAELENATEVFEEFLEEVVEPL